MKHSDRLVDEHPLGPDSLQGFRLRRVPIIGVPITAINSAACLDYIVEHFEESRGQYICVSNVHTTVMARENPAYYAIQSGSLMSVPDGKPLSLIGRRYARDMDRVTGADLMRGIFELSGDRGYRHFFYGNTAENLRLFVDSVKASYPGVTVAGAEPSVFRPLTDDEVQRLGERMTASRADFIWIALGAPRQEELCARLQGTANGLMIGIGGALNILAGIIPEAPAWMRNLSLEWLYRLIQEPKRLFRRYLVTNTKFVYYLLFSKNG